MTTEPRATRLIRARDLAKGVTFLMDCGVRVMGACPVVADVHQVGHRHEGTLRDIEIHDDFLSAICVSESGDQFARQWDGREIVLVYAPSADGVDQ